MRELIFYIFMFNLALIFLLTPIILIKLEQFSKLNLSDDNFRYTKECKEQMDKKQKEIDTLLNPLKITYVLILFMIIDTSFIFENSLRDAFNSNKNLICKDNGHIFTISNKNYAILDNGGVFLSYEAINNKDNISVNLANCQIKNKRWYE